MAEAVTIARPYAVAVFRLAKEKSALAKWSEMLAFAAAVAADTQVQALIQDPKLNSAELERIFLSICGNQLDAAGTNLIKLLVEYDRLDILSEIAALYEELKAQEEGVLEAEIIAAATPDEKQVKMLIDQLQTKFGKKVEASVKVDPEIIGGIKIVVGDTVIDASVRSQLQSLAYSLKG